MAYSGSPIADLCVPSTTGQPLLRTHQRLNVRSDVANPLQQLGSTADASPSGERRFIVPLKRRSDVIVRGGEIGLMDVLAR